MKHFAQALGRAGREPPPGLAGNRLILHGGLKVMSMTSSPRDTGTSMQHSRMRGRVGPSSGRGCGQSIEGLHFCEQ